jgi:uncharacterized membrane protein YcfT
MLKQRLMWILWPAFLLAGVAEMLVFSLVDPLGLYWFGQHIEASRQAVYTVSFFCFWLITATTSALTVLLSLSPSEVNHL